MPTSPYRELCPRAWQGRPVTKDVLTSTELNQVPTLKREKLFALNPIWGHFNKYTGLREEPDTILMTSCHLHIKGGKKTRFKRENHLVLNSRLVGWRKHSCPGLMEKLDQLVKEGQGCGSSCRARGKKKRKRERERFVIEVSAKNITFRITLVWSQLEQVEAYFLLSRSRKLQGKEHSTLVNYTAVYKGWFGEQH